MPIKQQLYNPGHTVLRRIYDPAGTMTSNSSFTYPDGSFASWHPSRSYWVRDYGKTVDYKTLRKSQGWLPTQYLNHYRCRVSGSFYSNTYRSGNGLERVEVQGGTIYTPASAEEVQGNAYWTSTLNPLLTSLRTDVQYKCLSKARDMRVNLPVALAEGRKTVQMLVKPAQTLYQAYRAFRKGNFNKAWRTLNVEHPFKKPGENLANHWLAYQYGWRPLLSDAVGAATLLYDRFEERPWKSFVTASADADELTGTGVAKSDNFVTGYYSDTQFTRNIRVSAGLLLEVEYTSAALAAQLGVGLTDPLLTVWELTPFSFVFDWFVDVGSWIEARSSLQGYHVRTGYWAQQIHYNGLSVQKYYSGPYRYPDTENLSWRWSVTQYNRTLWTGSVVSVKTPLFDALNGNRLTTLASLFRQRLSGDRKPGKYKP